MTTETTETAETESSEPNLLFDDDTAITPVDTDAAKHHFGQAALKRITCPAAGTMLAARVLTAISGMPAVAPYVALVHLGTLLLTTFRIHTSVDSEQVWFVFGLLIDAYLAWASIYILALAMTRFADVHLSRHVQTQLLDHIAHALPSWFAVTNSGRVHRIVQDNAKQLHVLVAHAPVKVTPAVIMPLSLPVYAFIIDWRLGLLSIATLPVFASLYWVMMRDMGPKTTEMDAKLGNVGATMVEFVTGLTVVKAFRRVGHAHSRYAKAAKEFADFYVGWCKSLLTGNAVALPVVSIAVLLFVNLCEEWLLVQAGYISAVDVLTAALIALLVPYPLQVLSMGAWIYQIAGTAALRSQDTLDTPVLPEVGSPIHERLVGVAGGTTMASTSKSQKSVNHVSDISLADQSKPRFMTPRIPGSFEVAFRDVSFSYGEVLAVDNVSLELQPGTVTALIGPSGSEKPTLVTLLAHFADPDPGAVIIGGVDLREIPSRELYRLVSFVLQDPQPLRDAIAYNIALRFSGISAGNKLVSSNDIRATARAAQIDDYIQGLPKGYDTVIGMDTDLSGGQAQRIAIARTILADAPILVMDEATAMSDPDCEAEIQAALSNLVRGRTVLAVTHRPASVFGTAQITVMDHGRLVACGTHTQLLAAHGPHYQKILQLTGYHEDDGVYGAPATIPTATERPATPSEGSHA